MYGRCVDELEIRGVVTVDENPDAWIRQYAASILEVDENQVDLSDVTYNTDPDGFTVVLGIARVQVTR